MTPEQMAELHARAFAGSGRAWTAQEFADLLKSATVFCVGDTRAFALGRVIADEAELLTLATAPDHRREGLGKAVLSAFEDIARQKGAQTAFLEVAHDNQGAIPLYLQTGYQEIARRRGYYRKPDGQKADALILQKRLGPAQRPGS